MISDRKRHGFRGWPVAWTLAVLATIPLLGLGLLQGVNGAPEQAVVVPAPAQSLSETVPTAKIVLAGGCFWGVQGVFQHLDGVSSAVSGYAGGNAATASYNLVGTGTTGHAEVVEVTYDPSRIGLGELLHVFTERIRCW